MSSELAWADPYPRLLAGPFARLFGDQHTSTPALDASVEDTDGQT
jgi:hypothetical protein